MQLPKLAFIASTAFFIALAGFAYGVAVGYYKVFPFDIGLEIKDEFTYLQADLLGGVDRFARTFSPPTVEQYRPIETSEPVFSDLVPLMSNSAGALPGFRAIPGTYRIDDELAHAVVLISPDMKVVHHWLLHEDFVDDSEIRKKSNKQLQGVHVLDDGSIVFMFVFGRAMQRFDWCGNPIWVQEGEFHHSIARSVGGDAVWTNEQREREAPEGHAFVEIDLEDGSRLRELTFDNVVQHHKALFEIRKKMRPEKRGGWLEDPFHFNDAEPLAADVVSRDAGFERGDLVFSARELNLLMVVDPASGRPKWWRIGPFSRQHDPDWHEDGTITVLDNNTYGEFSRILRLDPGSGEVETLLDGQTVNFTTDVAGNHQILPNGNIFVTSSGQGRVFEVDSDGDVVFEFLNVGAEGEPLTPGEDITTLFVTDAQWMPPDYFDDGLPGHCG